MDGGNRDGQARRRIGRYVTVGGGVLVLLILLVGGLSLFFLDHARTRTRQVVIESWPRAIAAQRLAVDASHLTALTAELPFVSSDAERKTTLQRIDGVKQALTGDLDLLRRTGLSNRALNDTARALQDLVSQTDVLNDLVQSGLALRIELARLGAQARQSCAAVAETDQARQKKCYDLAWDLRSGATVLPPWSVDLYSGFEPLLSVRRDLFQNEQRRLNLARRQGELAGRFLFLASALSDDAATDISRQQSALMGWAGRIEWMPAAAVLLALVVVAITRHQFNDRVARRIQALQTAMENWRDSGRWSREHWSDGTGGAAPLAQSGRQLDEIDAMARAFDDLLAEIAHRTEDLSRSNAELEQFAYVASHDLRQPLRMVGGYLTLVEREAASQMNDEMREYVAFALEGARRMDRLIVDLLEYSRLGSREMRLETVAIGDIVEICLHDLGPLIGECRAEVQMPPVWPMVRGDRGQVLRLFENLLGNAVKYRDESRAPIIALDCRQDGEMWEFSIADNGIGIRPQDFERIFGLFQRLVQREQYEGTGIGLAVCKRIVERLGGRIWVESQLGQGSVFRFTLPAATEAVLPSPSVAEGVLA